MTYQTQKLYYYEFEEACKYPRQGYTWDYTLKRVKDSIRANYLSPARIKIRLIGEETEEYCDQARLRKLMNQNRFDFSKPTEELFQDAYKYFQKNTPHGSLREWTDFLDEFVLPFLPSKSEVKN